MPIENQPLEQGPEQIPTHPQYREWADLAHEAETWPEDHDGLQQLRERHVNRLLGEQGLGHLVASKEDKAGARFVHQNGSLNPVEVEHVVRFVRENGTSVPNKAAERTIVYLDFMADPDRANDGVLTGDEESIERQIDAHVIMPENIPDNYFKLQQKIARERGHGDLEITQELRLQHTEVIQADQRGSLEKWVEYLGGDDGSYPDWFKRYTWDSMLTLGLYDKATGKFAKRDSTTVAPYPELNREALAEVFDVISKFHVLGEAVDDVPTKQLLKAGNFGRLYAHSLRETIPDSTESRQEVRGSWTRFHQSNDPRVARRLSGSLRGHGTGWCTAGEKTATTQLRSGDFYVYYTRDEDSKDTVPRVAVRMQNNMVAEVRGVLPEQDVELLMMDVVAEKFKNLPGGEAYVQRAADMKRLTTLDALVKQDSSTELSANDARFLYELDHKIEGFGYDTDPRIAELQLKYATREAAQFLEDSGANTELVTSIRNHVRIQELSEAAAHTPETDFSDADIRFIYGLDGPINSFDLAETENLARDVDMWRGGRDRDRLLALMPEAVATQYETSVQGYEDLLQSLGMEKADTSELQHSITEKIEEWESQGAYQYMLDLLIKHDTRFDLVITPNVIADLRQISTAVDDFGGVQESGSYVFTELYSQYAAEELSGKKEAGTARFSLIPNKPTVALGRASTEEQRSKLAALRSSKPDLNLKIPSVLEAVARWRALNARGGTVAHKGMKQSTLVRHIDLESKTISGWGYTPESYIGDFSNKKPALRGSNEAHLVPAYVAIG